MKKRTEEFKLNANIVGGFVLSAAVKLHDYRGFDIQTSNGVKKISYLGSAQATLTAGFNIGAFKK